MPFPVALGIAAVLELVKTGQMIVERYNNGALTQDEFDKWWHEMRTNLNAAVMNWEASKKEVPAKAKE